jgi:hypothetical protein
MKPIKSKKLARIKVERKAVKMYWTARLKGERVSRETVAKACGLEKTALSKNGFSRCMKDIRASLEKSNATCLTQRVDSTTREYLLGVVDEVLDKFIKTQRRNKG